MGVQVDGIHATGGAAINRDAGQQLMCLRRRCIGSVGNSAYLGVAPARGTTRGTQARDSVDGDRPWRRGTDRRVEDRACAHAPVYIETRRRYAEFESRYRTPSSNSTTS
jgi:hypothetical protein